MDKMQSFFMCFKGYYGFRTILRLNSDHFSSLYRRSPRVTYASLTLRKLFHGVHDTMKRKFIFVVLNVSFLGLEWKFSVLFSHIFLEITNMHKYAYIHEYVNYSNGLHNTFRNGTTA
jgi:hypothetical protein